MEVFLVSLSPKGSSLSSGRVSGAWAPKSILFVLSGRCKSKRQGVGLEPGPGRGAALLRISSDLHPGMLGFPEKLLETFLSASLQFVFPVGLDFSGLSIDPKSLKRNSAWFDFAISFLCPAPSFDAFESVSFFKNGRFLRSKLSLKLDDWQVFAFIHSLDGDSVTFGEAAAW